MSVFEWFLIVSTALMWVYPILQLILAVAGRRNAPLLPLAEGQVPTPVERFFLIVPALNEERVIGATAKRLLALDGGKAVVNVVIVDDGSDDGTGTILDSIESPRLLVLHRVLPDARQGKGEALNDAYRHILDECARNDWSAERSIVGIVDADGQPSSRLLVQVGEMFTDPDVAAVQARVRIRNTDSFWGSVQELEFSEAVNASQNVRDQLGSVALGGNGQFTRLSALELLGPAPWTKCLVEDLDLGLRLHMLGKKIRYTPDEFISQQGLEDTRRLLRQRARWTQGNIQCLSFAPQVSRAGHLRMLARVEMLSYLLMSVVGIIGALGLAVGIAIFIKAPTALDAPDFVLWMIALWLPGLVWATVYKRHYPDTSWWTFTRLSVGYVALVFVSAASVWRAWYRHLSGKQGWAKTERVVEGNGGPGLDERDDTGTVEVTRVEGEKRGE